MKRIRIVTVGMLVFYPDKLDYVPNKGDRLFLVDHEFEVLDVTEHPDRIDVYVKFV